MIDIIGWASVAVLLSVWLGYPLVVTMVAGLKKEAGPATRGQTPSVTVVIATQDSADVIAGRVANCLESAYPERQLDIVVAIDSRSTLPANVHFTDSHRVRVVRDDNPGGKAATLNVGVEAATGDVLVFADTHQRFDVETVPRLVDALQVPGIGAATGRLELRRSGNGLGVAQSYWRLERWLREREARVHSPVGVTGCVYAMPRRLWKPLPDNLLLDDLYVPMRLVLDGWRIAVARDAHALETRSPTPMQEYRRKVRTLTGIIQLCAWLPGVLVPVRNPIWLQFVFHKLLRFVTPVCTLGVLAWLGVVGVRLLGPFLPAAAAAMAMMAVWVIATPFKTARLIRNVVLELGLLQYATVVSLSNAVQGHWDVWRAPE